MIVPTRELAQQVANAAKRLKAAEYGGIHTLALYGGGREGKDAQLGTSLPIGLLLLLFAACINPFSSCCFRLTERRMVW